MSVAKKTKRMGVTGRVTTKEGIPISQAIIFISEKQEGRQGVPATSDGKYVLYTQTGTLDFLCTAEGYDPLFVKAVKIEKEGLTKLDFILEESKVDLEQPIKPPSAFTIDSLKVDGNTEKKVGSLIGGEPLPIKLTPGSGKKTSNDIFYNHIKKVHKNDFFKKYKAAMDVILEGTSDTFNIFSNGNGAAKSVFQINKSDKNHLPFNRTEAYSLLKFATEKYVEGTLGLDITALTGYVDNGRLPYYDLIVDRIKEFVVDRDEDIQDTPDEDNFLALKDQPILIELIWSYWHEEGMLVQTMNAIAKRFQNIRNGERDPLANLELDPLRPLNNIIWGYIQDAQHRLTIARRSYEYDHNYGLRLFGKAVQEFVPADSRSKFINAFHNLLYRASLYYKEADDMTINADAFPLLNALREVHLILSESSHNQYGDLPTVSRIEMLMEQWILSRPEIREFLGGRVMVPYKESWMDRVDTMKALQGWGDVSVSYYHDLATYGEQILLSIRLDNWAQIDDRDVARNWADLWRDAIQRYLHSYYSVTGVDLTLESFNQPKEEKFSMPAFLIQQKVQKEKMQKEKTFKRV